MKSKAVILLLSTVLAVSVIEIKGTEKAQANPPATSEIKTNQTSISPKKLNNFDIISQYSGSPWGQVVSSTTYRNPDTGQRLCFYSSSLWAPCPGQGDTIIIPSNGKCHGGTTMEDLSNFCPAAQCLLNGIGASDSLPCTGLP